jgi:outer membrane murein-binding lipoprotein Lpp
LFSALVVASGTALFLLSINAQEAPPRVRLVAGALTMLGTLLLVFCAPAYVFAVNVKKEHEELKGTVKTLVAQNQHLAEEVETLKAQIETRSIEQHLPEQQVPVRRKQDSLAHGSTD